jgi:glutamine synthetase
MVHITIYALTGKHETASIHDFSYGVSDRGCSIRTLMTVQKVGKVVEDRRPASNGDPYKLLQRIIQTKFSVVITTY